MNALNWFEIPVVDFERATRFYESIFATVFRREDGFPGSRMALFPYEQPGVGGCLLWSEHAMQQRVAPSEVGTRIYLNGGTNLQTVLDRVEAAGGAIVVPKTAISPEIGYFAIFRDTEGNVVGLHSLG